jgi:hypothetical protein
MAFTALAADKHQDRGSQVPRSMDWPPVRQVSYSITFRDDAGHRLAKAKRLRPVALLRSRVTRRILRRAEEDLAGFGRHSKPP